MTLGFQVCNHPELFDRGHAMSPFTFKGCQREDGGLLARVEVDDTPIQAPPVVYDDVVYVYTTGGELAALSVE